MYLLCILEDESNDNSGERPVVYVFIFHDETDPFTVRELITWLDFTAILS